MEDGPPGAFHPPVQVLVAQDFRPGEEHAQTRAQQTMDAHAMEPRSQSQAAK